MAFLVSSPLSSTPLLLNLYSPKPLHHHRHLLRLTPPKSSSSNNNNLPDRLLSATAYLYPFLDGVRYSKFLLSQYPSVLTPLLSPLLPAVRLLNSFPLNGLLVFLLLYFAVVRNPDSFSRFVRFNAMQAIVLDVLLIFPDLLERNNGLGVEFIVGLENTVFLYLLVCLVYGSGSCLLGVVPRLPLVADAAERQVM